MGLFDFFKDSGKEVLKDKSVDAGKDAETLRSDAENAILNYINQQHLDIDNLQVKFAAAEGKITLIGSARSREASEKAALLAGNIKGIANVENQLSIPDGVAENEVRYHDVQKGETLSVIAKHYYNDANQYMKIFEANKPMLKNPDEIYVGQKLRIPSE